LENVADEERDCEGDEVRHDGAGGHIHVPPRPNKSGKTRENHDAAFL